MSIEHEIIVPEKFDQLEPTGDEVVVSGQVLSIREASSVTFTDVGVPGVDKVQVISKLSEVSKPDYKIGDIVRAPGTTGESDASIRRGLGQVSVFSTQPPAILAANELSRWPGANDHERQNNQAKYVQALRKRHAVHSSVRRFFDDRGYVHIDTSVLQESPSGAQARSFSTVANFDGSTRHLRIAPEVDLKIVMARSGLSRVYEVARNFRNEGVSYAHHPEFTAVESYTAHADRNDAYEQVSELVGVIAAALCVPNPLDTFQRVSYGDLFERYFGKDFSFDKLLGFSEVNELNEYLVQVINKIGVHPEVYKKGPYGKLDYLFKKGIRPKLKGTSVIHGYLSEQMPLAASTPEDDRLADAFQVLLADKEIVKAYSEEVNAENLQRQLKRQSHEATDDRVDTDDRLVKACRMGLPPMYGVGVGLDRVHAILSGSCRISEVIPVPIDDKSL